MMVGEKMFVNLICFRMLDKDPFEIEDEEYEAELEEDSVRSSESDGNIFSFSIINQIRYVFQLNS